MSSCKVYVGNLAWGTDDPTLGSHFAPIGQVKDAVVMRSEGRSRGFGFVTFSSVQEAERAIATMNDTELQGRRLRVNVAKQARPAGTAAEWSPNGPSYMPYRPASFMGGNGIYPPTPFGAMYGQPNFVGYPPDMAYNTGSPPPGGPLNNQSGYYPHSSSTQYPYQSPGYNQQPRQPF